MRPGTSDAVVARFRVTPALARLGVSQLDLLVLTHADGDHVGAAAALAVRVPVAELWLPGCDTHSAAILAVARRVAATGGTVRQVQRGAPFDLGGASARILWPPPDVRLADGRCGKGMGRNDASVVLSLGFGGRRVLLTGDVEARAERELVALGSEALTADVLKVAHHGSRTSSTPPFLEAVQPSVALVSGALRLGTMPPHGEVLRRLRAAGAATWVTGRDGPVSVQIGRDGELEVGR